MLMGNNQILGDFCCSNADLRTTSKSATLEERGESKQPVYYTDLFKGN